MKQISEDLFSLEELPGREFSGGQLIWHHFQTRPPSRSPFSCPRSNFAWNVENMAWRLRRRAAQRCQQLMSKEHF